MEDEIHRFVHEQILRHILLDETVARIPGEVLDVGNAAGEKIVDADDAEALGEEPIRKVRTQKSGAPCDEGSLPGMCDVHKADCL